MSPDADDLGHPHIKRNDLITFPLMKGKFFKVSFNCPISVPSNMTIKYKSHNSTLCLCAQLPGTNNTPDWIFSVRLDWCLA